jgi:Ca-activated chloride channel family protein
MWTKLMKRCMVAGAAVLLGMWTAAPARADGLIVVTHPGRVVPGHFSFAPLEVTYHKVDCAITDQLAVTSVDQEFYNPNGTRLEGDYIFPIPVNAQINKFAMDIDGKTVEAELLPADKARAIYNEIVRQTRDPALLEYAGRAMFKVHIFPIEANSRKRIQLKYTELLKQDNGLLDYHYTLDTEKYSSKPLQNVSIKVSVQGAEPITTIYSPTHEIDIVRHGEREATAGFEAKNVRPDADFHLFIGRKGAAVGINLLTYRPDPEKEGYFVLLASPGVNNKVKALPKDVVFVMDTSGSMAGAKIEQARKALKYCIDTLNPQDRFDVVRFSTEAEPLFGALKEANGDNQKRATEFVAGLKAAGGTAIDEALGKALGEHPVDWLGNRVFMLVFMTDGQPTVGESNPDTILKHAKEMAAGGPQVRIFSFGVGTDVNTKLLDVVAEQTRGYSQYVLPNENLELSMSNFWGKVQDPVLASLKLDSGEIGLSKIYPHELPDLFKGDQLVVFGTYGKPGKGAVTLTGKVNGEEQRFAQDVTFEEKTDSSREWIAKLWATRRVGYLLDEIRLRGESREVKEEIVELARRWGVVTPYTAMLIIEDERQRNVPLAQRSMREMEFDRVAGENARQGLDSLVRGQAAGSQAVANSINGDAYKSVNNLQQRDLAAEQGEQRYRFDGQEGAALAKGLDAPSASSPGSTGFGGGGGGGFGGRGGGGRGAGRPSNSPGAAATPSPVTASPAELNLGNQVSNGWQTAGANGSSTGYRTVSNYAQQTRVINNRSFFLNGNQWTDAEVQQLKDPKHVKIAFNSAEYFDLIAKYPVAGPYLSLGNNLTLELGGVVYDIVDDAAPAGK